MFRWVTLGNWDPGNECVAMALIYMYRSFHSADPADYSSVGRYRVDFPQTTITDSDYPEPFADSLPITIYITDDTIFEGLEYFQAHIVKTSDLIRVRIGQQNTVNWTIIDDDRKLTIFHFV